MMDPDGFALGVRARGTRPRELLDEPARWRPEIGAVCGAGLMDAMESGRMVAGPAKGIW